jgi:hypothetical protein
MSMVVHFGSNCGFFVASTNNGAMGWLTEWEKFLAKAVCMRSLLLDKTKIQ